ncbi:MAG: efflux RND transporter periplasmic adaptor subunit [Pedobacter sp.]|nr:MAG: efflux RND transporter periplasmic adaptor subunit [Pedobacter sp.]
MNFKKYSLFLILSWTLSACQPASQEPSNTAELGTVEQSDNTLKLTSIQLKHANLAYSKLVQKPIHGILKLNGKIDVPPQSMVSISAPLGGYLKDTKLLPGMHVKKGEIIATLEDPQYIQIQQDYLQTQSQLNLANLEYERQKNLLQNMATSQKTLEQVAAQREGLQIALSAIAQKLNLIGKNPTQIKANSISKSVHIYAPLDGFVTAVNVNIGRYVSPTEVLFELVNPADIHLSLNVYEKDLANIFIGQEVLAYTNSQPEVKHQGDVLIIGKSLNNNRSTEVHCHFDKYDKALIPGTYMNAEIKIKTKNAMVLPEEALVRYENKFYIFLKQGDLSFKMVEVQVGMYESELVEILNGEAFKDKEIVVRNAYTLLMALKNVSEAD